MKNFLKLSKKTVDAGERKLAKYITADRYLAMLAADDAAMQRLAAAWPEAPVTATKGTALMYDAISVCRLLGLPTMDAGPPPAARRDEIMLYYPGLSLPQLRDNKAVRSRNLMLIQNWYERHAWGREGLELGYYGVRLPIPGSSSRDTAEQAQLLRDEERALPVCIGATLLLVHALATWQDGTFQDLLRNDWVRCLEQTSPGVRAGLTFGSEGLYVDVYWSGYRGSSLWGGSARKAS